MGGGATSSSVPWVGPIKPLAGKAAAGRTRYKYRSNLRFWLARMQEVVLDWEAFDERQDEWRHVKDEPQDEGRQDEWQQDNPQDENQDERLDEQEGRHDEPQDEPQDELPQEDELPQDELPRQEDEPQDELPQDELPRQDESQDEPQDERLDVWQQDELEGRQDEPQEERQDLPHDEWVWLVLNDDEPRPDEWRDGDGWKEIMAERLNELLAQEERRLKG